MNFDTWFFNPEIFKSNGYKNKKTSCCWSYGTILCVQTDSVVWLYGSNFTIKFLILLISAQIILKKIQQNQKNLNLCLNGKGTMVIGSQKYKI